VEWGEATQEDVQDDAAAPDVGFLAVRATEHFRGCVCECVRACVCVCACPTDQEKNNFYG
jgi:hypothetical protein